MIVAAAQMLLFEGTWHIQSPYLNDGVCEYTIAVTEIAFLVGSTLRVRDGV